MRCTCPWFTKYFHKLKGMFIYCIKEIFTILFGVDLMPSQVLSVVFVHIYQVDKVRQPTCMSILQAYGFLHHFDSDLY